MADIRSALEGIPEVSSADIEEIEKAIRGKSTQKGIKAEVKPGPKEICLIKCAIKFGICKAQHKQGCNTAFAECVKSCYLP